MQAAGQAVRLAVCRGSGRLSRSSRDAAPRRARRSAAWRCNWRAAPPT